jgi:muramoyltetrapeptide carboxypeptidase
MAIQCYGNPNTPTDYTHNNLMSVLSGYSGVLPKKSKWISFRRGKAEGRLIGGNLWTISVMVGTQYCPPDLFNDAILLLEEIGVNYGRIDARIAQLEQYGVLDRINAVVIGKLQGCEAPENTDMTIKDLLLSAFGKYNFPIIYDCDFGHVPDNLCLPIGCKAKIVADKSTELVLLESGVKDI